MKAFLSLLAVASLMTSCSSDANTRTETIQTSPTTVGAADTTAVPVSSTSLRVQPPRSPLEVVIDDAVGRDAVVDVFEHDQYGVLVRLGAGNPVSESEAAVRDALVLNDIEFVNLLVYECSYTAAELAELLEYLDSDEWREPDGGTPKARADLSRDVTGGLISNCAVVFPVDCATPSEIDRIVEHAASLNVTNIDMWTGGRGDILNPPDGAALQLGRPVSNCPDN